MYLKKLELFGFKSFADKVNIEFKDGITAIVGPNGSGKSNVSDAIKWVLGEQRVKSLRGSKMEDIIFSGTEIRKSLGYAQVTLTIDNESGVFPIEFSEISVTRRLFRSGDSEYSINKSICRLKDIQDLFSDTGLGKEGYSIIGQGKIDHIVSSNPQERRLLLEEAAGIVKYKNRKLESERKLEKTQDNLYRITDIISELEKQLPTLEIQAQKAMTYLDLRENLKKIELNLYIHKVDSIKQDLSKLTEDKEGIRLNILDKGKELSDKDIEYQNERRKIQELDDKLNELNQNNLELSEINQKSYTNIQVSLTKIEHNKNSTQTIQKDMLELEEINKNLNEKIESLKEELDRINKQLQDDEKYHVMLNEQKTEKENIGLAYRQSYTRRKEDVEQLKNQINNDSNKINILENQKLYSRENLENLQKRIIDLQRLVEENKKVKSQLNNEEVNIDEQIIRTSQNIANNKQVLQVLVQKAEEINKKMKINEVNLNMSSSKYNLMKNNEDLKGYHNSVKELLKEKKTNHLLRDKLHDIVGNVLDVPKKYALAIETALGNTIYNLITEDEDIAHECIKILSKNKWGRATFLPLNIIKGQPLKLGQDIKAQNGYIDLGCNLIDFDKKYTGIFHSLLGKVIIVEDLNCAKYMSKSTYYKYKIVTLQGEILYPGGAIVGGVQKNSNKSIILRKQEILDLEININLLKEQIDVFKNELSDVQDTVNLEKEKLEKMQASLHGLSTEKRLIEHKTIQVTKEIKTQMENVENLQLQFNKIKANEEKSAIELSTLQEKVEALKLSLKKLDAEAIVYKDDDVELERIEIDKKIMECKLSIAKQEEKQLYLQAQQKEYMNTLHENSNKQATKKNEIFALNKENDQLEREISENDKRVQGFEEKKKKINEEYEKYSHSKIEKNVKIDALQERIKELNNENVQVNEAFNKIENKINSKNIELEHLQQNIYETYQMNYGMAIEYRYTIHNMNEELKLMKEHKDRIKSLGQVNVGAMEQYKEIKERFEFLTFQREDLTKAKDSLKEIIDEIAINMQTQFIEQFNLIDKEFGHTFKKLFDGGDAHLIIEDPSSIMDTGIEIEVQPPGKKLKNITLLSGGEKALTAIALLFAIINIKPTPFCVLDEIDAALDDSNVDRFSNYLQKVSKENQFITITHRKGTMEIADRLYGVSMGKDGVSKVVSVEVAQMLKDEVT